MARDGSGRGGGSGGNNEQTNGWKNSQRLADIAKVLERQAAEKGK